MLREHDSFFRKLLITFDLIVITAGFFLGYHLRNNLFFFYSKELTQIYELETYLGQLPLIILIWGGNLYFHRAYAPFRGRSLSDFLKDISQATLVSALMFASCAYLLKYHFLSRTFIGVTFLTGWLLLCIDRAIIYYTLRHFRKKGYNYRSVLIVGTGPRAQNYMAMLQKNPDQGLKVMGLVDIDQALVGKEFRGHLVMGTLDDIPKILKEHVVDEVTFIVPRSWLIKIENSLLFCEQLGKRVNLAVDIFSLKFSKMKQTGFHDFPLLSFQSTPDNIGSLFVKRLLDILISGSAIVILSPLLLGLIILIKTKSTGPAFFKQKRCSLNGRTFTMYKFRTMVPNAEKMLDELRKHNEMTGPAFKMADDPRIIPGGKWIRKYSLDELPQIFHVFMGDMSIVGPRPPIPSEVELYEPWQRRRLSMRPGLTCLWQIQGRNKIVNFDDWMRLDLQYIDEWSLWLDLKIFLKTFPVVLFAVGAK